MSLAHLSPGSRVWFFIADRPLNANEAEQLNQTMTEFIGGWKSHGSALSAGYEIRWNALLVVAVDESIEAPSGCSIDKVFRLLSDFTTATGIDLLNRLLLLVPDNADTASIYTRQLAAAAIETGTINENTPVADIMHIRLETFVSQPLQPFRDHWMGKQLLNP
ncbi:MAG: hypothetical protein EBV15_01120 [Bacteroidetes bacterium]|nr:hypothetical protein [Bacteroidota bacterium]